MTAPRCSRPALLPVLLLALACGKGAESPPAAGTAAAAASPAPGDELSPFELENGIGPITKVVVLGETVDHELAEEGKELFQVKCSACHKMGEDYVGPALGEVLQRRSPTFVMNMILNPQGMYEHHPITKQLLAKHLSFMPNQGLTPDEAREVVEYLRTQLSTAAK